MLQTSEGANNRGPGGDPYRLPRTVRPSRYDLRFDPDPDLATFAGTVDVPLRRETNSGRGSAGRPLFL